MLIPEAEVDRGKIQKCIFSLPKWVQNTHPALRNPPECQISSKCQWFRYNIKYVTFRLGIGCLELGGELSETGWGGLLMGTARGYTEWDGQG
jgi:hypothetical protein